MSSPSTDNRDLATIRAGFILQGTTFKAWCRLNRIDPGYAHHIAAGKLNGPKACALRELILTASQRAAA